MAEMISSQFTANGDSPEFVASEFTILLGTDTNANYGGGTVSVKVKQDSQKDWTTQESFTADQQVKTTFEYTSGLRVKLTMAGSTTPALDYSIKYE